MRVALGQISSTTDIASNLKVIADFTHKAKLSGADIIVFPEAAICRFGVKLSTIAQSIHGNFAQQIIALSTEYDIGIIAGSFTPSPDKRVYNTLLIVLPGEELQYYHKIHCYDAFNFQESETVAAGEQQKIFSFKGYSFGVATCYDIRFPYLFTQYGQQGADAIIVAASWADGPMKLDHWRLLSKARALDSASYILSCDQALPQSAIEGIPLGIGHSLICSPLGEILVEAGDGPEIIIADLNREIIAHSREQLGVLHNSKPHLTQIS